MGVAPLVSTILWNLNQICRGTHLLFASSLKCYIMYPFIKHLPILVEKFGLGWMECFFSTIFMSVDVLCLVFNEPNYPMFICAHSNLSKYLINSESELDLVDFLENYLCLNSLILLLKFKLARSTLVAKLILNV